MKVDRCNTFDATKKCAVGGAAIASGAGAFTVAAPAIVKGLSRALPIQEKKKVVTQLIDAALKNGVDLSKTTAFRSFKQYTSVMKKPRVIAAGLVAGATIGALVGLAVDAIRCSSKKSA